LGDRRGAGHRRRHRAGHGPRLRAAARGTRLAHAHRGRPARGVTMGFVSWLLQIIAVVRISLGSLPERAGTALVAVLGFAGVVLVFTGMLSIREGFEGVVQRNGSPDVAVILRGGSTSELTSGISLENVRTIAGV